MGRLHRLWLLVVACLVASCGGGDDGGAGDGGAAAARGNDEVVIAAGEDIWPLTGQGPSAKHFAAGELNVGVYEPLVSLAPDFTARPGLAERWELVGPTTWRFHLRRDVRFHDGRLFGADDVVWSWTGRQFLPTAVSNTLAGVTKVDDHTVDFLVNAPNHRLPEQLVHPEGPIVPRNGHNDSTPPVGTGPFKVVDYRPRQRVVVEAFDGYWGEKAKARRLTFVFRPEAKGRVQALRDGEADIATNIPGDMAATLGGDRRFQVVRAPLGVTQSVTFNASATTEQPVREAVSLAVDRARYVTEVLNGNGEPGRWLTVPAVLGSAASLVEPSRHDPAQARRLLDESGWRPGGDGVRVKEGRRLTLTLIGGLAVPEAGLRVVQAQLKDVGIEVATKRAADTVTFQEYRQRPWDIDLGQSNQNDANPAFLATGRSSAERVAASLAADSRDGAQRVAAEMMRTLVNEEFQVIPLAHTGRTFALAPGIALGDAHPSSINQSWVGVTASR